MHPKNFAPLSEGLRGNGCFKVTPSKNLCQILRRLVVCVCVCGGVRMFSRTKNLSSYILFLVAEKILQGCLA